VFNGNYTSIIHHFRETEVFLLAGNDVKALSTLGGGGGAVSDSSLRIVLERPILVALTFFVYLEPFTSYSTLLIWLGFQHQGVIWGSF
jgi:hypothetical protein